MCVCVCILIRVIFLKRERQTKKCQKSLKEKKSRIGKKKNSKSETARAAFPAFCSQRVDNIASARSRFLSISFSRDKNNAISSREGRRRRRRTTTPKFEKIRRGRRAWEKKSQERAFSNSNSLERERETDTHTQTEREREKREREKTNRTLLPRSKQSGARARSFLERAYVRAAPRFGMEISAQTVSFLFHFF